MKLYLTLLLCLTMVACSSPESSKCQSTAPGIISVEDNFTGQCIEINISKVRVFLDQGRYTYLMTVDAQDNRDHFKVVESYDIVQRKIDAAYGRLE